MRNRISRGSGLSHGSYLISRRAAIQQTGALIGVGLLGVLRSSVSHAQLASFSYFISPTGSDTNPGTLASPWAITSLLDPSSAHATSAGKSNYALLTGRSVGVLAGTYNLSGLCDPAVVSDYRPILSIPGGSTGSPTVIASCSASGVYTPQAAVLDCGNVGSTSTAYFYAPAIGSGDTRGSSGNITVAGFQIQNCNGAGINFYYGSSSGTNLVIQDNVIQSITTTKQGNNPAHIRGQQMINTLITNNTCHDYGANVETSAIECPAILFYHSNGITVSYNTVYNVQVGIRGKGNGDGNGGLGDNKNCTVAYNFIEALLGQSVGIMDFCSTDTTSVNYFYNNISHAQLPFVHGGVYSNDGPSDTNFVFNNTFYSTLGDGSAGFCYCATSIAGGVKFYNNVFALTGRTTGYLGEWNTIAGCLGLSDFNCYTSDSGSSNTLAMGSGSNWMSAPTTYTLAGWRTANGTDAHSIAANPMLVGPTALSPASFKLASGSPCIGAGRIGGTSSGAATDMGAWGNNALRIGSSLAAPPMSPVPMTVS